MYQTVEVLAVIDDANKIYYTEDKNFALNDREAINQALDEYARLVVTACTNGYQIIKREKKVTPTDTSTMGSRKK